jgi:hypothetical protein
VAVRLVQRRPQPRQHALTPLAPLGLRRRPSPSAPRLARYTRGAARGVGLQLECTAGRKSRFHQKHDMAPQDAWPCLLLVDTCHSLCSRTSSPSLFAQSRSCCVVSRRSLGSMPSPPSAHGRTTQPAQCLCPKPAHPSGSVFLRERAASYRPLQRELPPNVKEP